MATGNMNATSNVPENLKSQTWAKSKKKAKRKSTRHLLIKKQPYSSPY